MSHRIRDAAVRFGLLPFAVGFIGAAPLAHADQEMSHREMADMMEMDDTSYFGKVMLDQLEWRDGGAGESRAAWDAQAWYGGDYDKLWVKTEGDEVGSAPDKGLRAASAEILWNRVISRWWSVESGVRQDFGSGASRTWAALGIQGLAPQEFRSEATFYASDEGRTSMRLKADYEVLLAQRLVLQPYAEANLYGRSDPQHQLGSGLSDMEVSLRLRYELRRELAPYVGVVWLRRFGGTADLARAAGARGVGEAELAAGVRAWF